MKVKDLIKKTDNIQVGGHYAGDVIGTSIMGARMAAKQSKADREAQRKRQASMAASIAEDKDTGKYEPIGEVYVEFQKAIASNPVDNTMLKGVLDELKKEARQRGQRYYDMIDDLMSPLSVEQLQRVAKCEVPLLVAAAEEELSHRLKK